MVKVLNQHVDKLFTIYNGDSCDVIRGLPDSSIGYSIYSPPFADLYVYSNSAHDMGNCKNYDQFFDQFVYLASEMYRVLKPGRSMSFHCMLLPTQKQRDGYIGLRDFRGDLIRLFEKVGFIFHSEVVIWKDPLIAATRTKALGLMHKQLMKDSAICRQGIPDYLITMRKRGDNTEYIGHENGLTSYAGSNCPKAEGIKQSHLYWQRYASPVWMDIRTSHTLQKGSARDDKDEKHICPLQLDVIERCLTLWSNPDDVILSPFMGIGSEGYKSLEMGRKFIGIELKKSYFDQAKNNLLIAQENFNNGRKSLFD